MSCGESTPAFEGTPKREGYSFAGWSPAVASEVSGDAIYTAIWTLIPTYTVRYTDGADGEEIFADQVTSGLLSGAATPLFIETPSREGYNFKGWSPEVETDVTADVTYTAVWAQIVDSGECGDNGDNVTWTLDEDGLLTISGEGEMMSYSMISPPWTTYGNNITSAVIADGVTSIYIDAFYGCTGLVSILVEDGNSSFSSRNGILFNQTQTTLVAYPSGQTGSYTIPDSVTSIGSSAFRGCTSLTSVSIPNSVTSIGSSAFRGCTSLTSVSIPNSVTSIGYNAFYGCTGLVSVSIPNSVTSIGYDAFSGCTGLTDVYYAGTPAQWASISKGTNNAPLTSATIHYNSTGPDDVPTAYGTCGAEGGNLTWVLKNGVLTISGTGEMAGYTRPDDQPWKDYREQITKAVIESGVTSIGAHTFRFCANLTGVTIPESVRSIGAWAFGGCTVLADAKLPASLTNLGEAAFAGCAALTSVTIPAGVASISARAFFGCGLTSVTIPAGVTGIGEQAFSGCAGLTGVRLPAGVETIDTAAFFDCAGLTSVILPDSVSTIGDGAFYGCGINDVYYAGPAEQWNNITINVNNGPLTSASIHYNYTAP